MPLKSLGLFFMLFFIYSPAALTGHHEKDHNHSHFAIGTLLIHNPWVKATPPGISNSAIYFELMNNGDNDIELVKAQSPAAGLVEIHEHVMADGLMKMQKVNSISIPAGKSVIFEPGGYHVMLIGVKSSIKAGDEIDVTLTLSSGESQTITAKAKDDKKSKHHHHH